MRRALFFLTVVGCIVPQELEFINWQDVLAVFDAIEEHFDSQNMVPQINLYDDE